MKIVNPENENGTTRKKDSTGKQIQNIASLLCGLGWFASIIGGMVFFAADNTFAGIIVVAVGCYGAWASTRCLQGFGELIEDTAANRANTDRILFALESIRKILQTNTQQNKKEPEA